MKFRPGNLGLRAKIMSVSITFLTGMILIFVYGGYVVIDQYNQLENAVRIASERVAASSNTRTKILSMERDIQALIANDEAQAIRTAAISTIRGGAAVDEELAMLDGSFRGDDAKVTELIRRMQTMRPKQMQVIAKGRANNDEEALALASSIQDEFNEIAKLSSEIVASSESKLVNDLDASKTQAFAALKIVFVVGVIGVFIGFIIALMGVRMMSRPLTHIQKTMQAMATGDLRQDIEIDVNSNDEIAQTIKATRATIENLRKMVGRISEASGNVNKEAASLSNNASSIGEVSKMLDEIVNNIEVDTNFVSNAAMQACENANSALQSAQSTSDIAEQSATGILDTVSSFNSFQSKIENTAKSSQELAGIASKITTITKTISDISEQTNLLALNAAIEAARAGEQGRGFAVVADEVRTLAGRTGKAVDEISELVSGIGTSIDDTVNSIESAREDIVKNIEKLQDAANKSNKSSEQAKSISNEMREMANIIETQREATERISGTVAELSTISSDNNAQAVALHTLSETLGNAAVELNNVVSKFNV